MAEPSAAAEGSARRATEADVDLVTDVVTLAFANDPLWSRALARPDGSTGHERGHWRMLVAGCLGSDWTWIAGEGQAVSVWIAPGGNEMTEAQAAQLAQLALDDLGAAGAATHRQLLARFEEARPRAPHYYLSLLGTHPAHRGKGVGMHLLAHDLALIDAEHQPAYLESTNPVNLARYRGVGFEPLGSFEFPGGGPVVTTMWRPAR
jgi:GNAT superfamily N-acetyltransferase